MIEMDGVDSLWKLGVTGTDDRLQHLDAGIFACALGNLDDEGRLGLEMAAEETDGLFHIVDVIGAHSEFPIGDAEEIGGRDDHAI